MLKKMGSKMADMAGRAMAARRQSGAATPDANAEKAAMVARAARGAIMGRGRRSGVATASAGNAEKAMPSSAAAPKGAAMVALAKKAARRTFAKGGEAKKDGKMPAFLMDKMKKGDMADKTGRAVKRKTADVKGRAMKKGA